MGLLKKKAGFISISCLLIVVCIFSLGLFHLYFVHQLQTQSLLRTTCIKSFTEAHKYLNLEVDKLLALNKRSTLLKTQQEFLEYKLSAALASGNMALAANLEAKILEVVKQRIQLETSQKKIITTAQHYITNTIDDYKNSIHIIKSKYAKQTQDYQKFNFGNVQSFITKFSVYPVTNDLAPNYKISESFSDEQKFRIEWNAHWFALKKFRVFQNYNFKMKESCEVRSELKVNKWQIKIKMDKWS